MNGIKLKHGTMFVVDDGVTVKISKNGECTISPVLLESLEWDLRTEGLDAYEYIYDADVLEMGEDVYRKVKEISSHVNGVLKG